MDRKDRSSALEIRQSWASAWPIFGRQTENPHHGTASDYRRLLLFHCVRALSCVPLSRDWSEGSQPGELGKKKKRSLRGYGRIRSLRSAPVYDLAQGDVDEHKRVTRHWRAPTSASSWLTGGQTPL
ncbi:hypothetical protein JZ751_017528 [Albula glossodonta]|uniref:Uncharacterized protein n=1 Tax=Albula glossodonta TaxID=121402 RepID=A0A8T2PNK4_9TELE|nr:hypothetical protein JZ751_017528 [Albula glossodonta]